MEKDPAQKGENEIRKLNKSFRHAFRGLKYTIANERNFQIELIAAAFVIALIFIFKVKSWEAIILILMIMWVLVTELTNTVVERVADIIKPRVHPYSRLVKDIMAAVVLISSVIALAVGIIIFYPYILKLFNL